MSSSSRLVVAFDLVCEQYVFAPIDRADPRVLELKAKSVAGDRSLVCAACYTDHGLAVPVVVRSQQGGKRRPHFAHPPGCAPIGGEHRPETLWHLDGKMALAQWARRQPGVIDVRTEVWLPRRERRSDVRVVFADGLQVALEVQNGSLTDDEWTDRHEDYRRNDVVDVWAVARRLPHALDSRRRSRQLRATVDARSRRGIGGPDGRRAALGWAAGVC